MLSKIKSPSMAADRRPSLGHNNNNNSNQASDNEDSQQESIDSDTNNNNNNNNNLNANQQGKRTQDELLDIVETSRKRRLSKDSADSLTSFIRWSFTHLDSGLQTKQVLGASGGREDDDAKSQAEQQDENLLLDVDDNTSEANNVEQDNNYGPDEPADWSVDEDHHALARRSASRLLRNHEQVKSACATEQATNLALVPRAERQTGALMESRASKRGRPQAQSPTEHQADKLFTSSNGTTAKKSSSYLGSVVERLHQQQQQFQMQQQQQHQLQSGRPDDDDTTIQVDDCGQVTGAKSAASNQNPGANGLSFHLQQFLEQQTSLEDLCSSVGLDEGNQLTLAAALHRALADQQQAGGGQQQPIGQHQLVAGELKASNGPAASVGGLAASMSAAGANGLQSLAESLGRQQQQQQQQTRAYNTRAGGLSHAAAAAAAASLARQQQQSIAMNMSNRIHHHHQQQRHAQAAAALSALASGAHPLHFAAAAAAAAAAGPNAGPAPGLAPGSLIHHQQQQNNLTATIHQMVEFKCDICPSSFDDRHRLMQHQSIHLELKKDWFTETPVDEVMKIFNRRRGEFLCNICNLRFEATLDYDQHNHAVHGSRPYCCQFCGNGTRTFKCWRQYLNHLYDHRYIFSCTIDDCDFTVNRRDSLRFHIFRFHLNCQLPQNQLKSHQHQHQHQHQHELRGRDIVSLTNKLGQTKWPSLDEEDDTENEMTVADCRRNL